MMKYLASLLLVITVFSCSKTEVTVTRTQLLTRSWKQTDLLASTGGSAPTSVFNQFLSSCQQDNIWQFKSDGTYIVTEGATKCGTSDTVTTGTWTLTENDTKLTFVDATNGTQTFTISELTTNSLKLSGVQIYQNTPINVVAVFSGY